MSAQPSYQRVHRLTPLLRLWSVILAVIAAFALNVNMEALRGIFAFVTGEHSAADLRDIGLALAGFIAVCAVVWLVSGVWWRQMGYQLGEEELTLRRGVISKQQRTARYDRTQAVDVVEPVIARLFRLAAVRVETAGGQSSAIEIAFLAKRDAEALRAEILSRVHGEPRERPAEERPAEEQLAEGADNVLIPEIPIARSLAAAALHVSTIVLLAALIFLVVTPMSLTITLPILLATVPRAWNVIDSSWRYTASLDDGVLNITYGLADRRRQNIRLERIHAVQVTQPFLWRPFD